MVGQEKHGDFRPVLYHTLREIQDLREALFLSVAGTKYNTPPSLFLKIYPSQAPGLEFSAVLVYD
jgi:hypothetical protein